MKSTLIKIALVLGLVCSYSCTKEINIDVAHTPHTVIYGQLTNKTAPVSVFIQQSVVLNSSSQFKPVNNAKITLYTRNNSGTQSMVTNKFNVDSGTYTTTQAIAPVIGNRYWIEVTLNDGTLFRSEEEILKKPVLINNVEIKNQDIANITFSDPGNETNFYQTNIELLNNGTVVSRNKAQSNDVVFNGNADASVEIDLISNQNEDDDMFAVIYDKIRVTLGNINYSSYQFLLNLSIQQENNDSESSGDPSQLFAAPPTSLFGNITNTATNRKALGNFTIVSVDTISLDNK